MRRCGTDEPIKAVFFGLGGHTGYDHENPLIPAIYKDAIPKPCVQFDMPLWRELLKRAAEAGMNTVVIELAEGVRYESHPELAIRGSWSTNRLKREIAFLRTLGLTPVPLINFSACHDFWLGKYARMVSTDAYYAVVKDLIDEVSELFGRPKLFHLGMDEEQYHDQEHYEYVVIRQYDLWWRDFYFMVDLVERTGARAWVWSDYLWHHPDMFWKKMPKGVLQSNWYYGAEFGLSKRNKFADRVRCYMELDEHGYDQVPTASNFLNDINVERTVRFCARNVARKRLKGFLAAAWKPTIEARRGDHVELIKQAGRAFSRWDGGRGRA
ncbi:MAG: Tat pathway signal protein [Planctomycetota bacterium]